jgi:hypothetical protein
MYVKKESCASTNIIDGRIPPNSKIAWKLASISGEIPPIDFKNGKIRGFALHKRKASAYLPRNGLYFVNNRKFSA